MQHARRLPLHHQLDLILVVLATNAAPNGLCDQIAQKENVMTKVMLLVAVLTGCTLNGEVPPDAGVASDALITCPDCGGGGSASPSPGGGNGPPPPVARVTACTDQAVEWCGAAGFGTSPVSGCATVYLQECNIAGPPIDGSKHRACMLAIDSNPAPSQIPQPCVDSWR